MMNEVIAIQRRVSILEKNASDIYWGLDGVIVYYAQARQKEQQEAAKLEEARKLVEKSKVAEAVKQN